MKTLCTLLLVVSTWHQVLGTHWQLKWSPRAREDGLLAFEGVEDDRAQSDPGVQHIYVEDDHYRFDMPLHERDLDYPDRQRNEVKGMVDTESGNIISLLKGERWKLEHKLYIPSSLKATTSFTHIMQLISPGKDTGGPILTISLRKNHIPTVELRIHSIDTVLASTSLEPLQNSWIHSSIDVTVDDIGSVRWVLENSRNVTVVNRKACNQNLWQKSAERMRPKWGIYRSIKDEANLENCSMLVMDLKAWKFVNSTSALARPVEIITLERGSLGHTKDNPSGKPVEFIPGEGRSSKEG